MMTIEKEKVAARQVKACTCESTFYFYRSRPVSTSRRRLVEHFATAGSTTMGNLGVEHNCLYIKTFIMVYND